MESQGDSEGETRLRLLDGPVLIVPALARTEGRRVTVSVRAEDVLLAQRPIQGLSAAT